VDVTKTFLFLAQEEDIMILPSFGGEDQDDLFPIIDLFPPLVV